MAREKVAFDRRWRTEFFWKQKGSKGAKASDDPRGKRGRAQGSCLSHKTGRYYLWESKRQDAAGGLGGESELRGTVGVQCEVLSHYNLKLLRIMIDEVQSSSSDNMVSM